MDIEYIEPDKISKRGYILDRTGIRVWPRKKYWARWRDLIGFGCTVTNYSNDFQYQTKLEFSSGKKADITWSRGAKNARELCVVFRWVKETAPDIIAPEMGEEFIREVEAVPNHNLKLKLPPSAELLARAKFHFQSLEFKKMHADCKTLIRAQSQYEEEARVLQVKGYLVGRKLYDAEDAFFELVKKFPDNVEGKQVMALGWLGSGREEGVKLAKELIEDDMKGSGDLVLNLAIYHVQKKDHVEAQRWLDVVLDDSNGFPEPYKKNASAMKAELTRLDTDPKYAFREGKLKPMGWKVVSGAFLLILMIVVIIPPIALGVAHYQEASKLLQLRRDGVRLSPEYVEIIESKDLKDSFQGRIRYSFVLKPAIFEREREIKAALSDKKSLSPRDQFDLEYELHKIWIKKTFGNSRMLYWEYKDVLEIPKFQYVTYLTENPRINAIGPITNIRIYLNWIGQPLLYIYLLVFSIILIAGAIETRKRKMRRKARGNFREQMG